MGNAISLRHATRSDWDAVAKLIYYSTNHWYESHGKPAIFQGPIASTLLFCEVYEALAPGASLLVAEPSGHIGAAEFERTVATATENGFLVTDRPRIRCAHAVILTKPRGGEA